MEKRLAMLLVAAALMICSAARAEIHLGQRPPESWADQDVLRIISIDVERSDAMLVSCGGEHMLVDAGTTYYAPRVVATLEERGADVLKYMFSTHSDDDHIGGFMPIINGMYCQVGEFLSPNSMNYRDEPGFHQRVMNAVRGHDVAYRVVEDGEVLTLGGAEMTVLRCMEKWGRNNRSACLSIRFGDSRMLLTGDIGAIAMEHFLEKYDHELLRADIMKAPHHGIVTIPASFMQAVNPAFMFVTNAPQGLETRVRDIISKQPELSMLFSAQGSIVMETDGTDWYVWQEENWY